MAVKMDNKDNMIINLLSKNAKLTTQQISEKTLLPTTTVHNRIKKLEKEGVIKNYTVVLDNKKMGKNISAYILANVDYVLLQEIYKSQNELAQALHRHHLVEEVSMLTGSHDILLRVIAKDIDELNDFVTVYLRNVGGISKTETIIILSSF